MAINTLFQDIADAIRTRGGTSAPITPTGMPQAILDIPGGGAGVITGTIPPTAAQGNEGDLYAQYRASYSGVPITINILSALRGSSPLSYAGASELDIIFSNGNNTLSMRDQSGFTYSGSGSNTMHYAFDNNPSTYWEANPTPLYMTLQATIPDGYYPYTLKVMQRTVSFTTDVWKSFNIKTAKNVLAERDNMTLNDWAGAGIYTDFPLIASKYFVEKTYIKINGEWIEQSNIIVNVEV